MNFSKKEGFTLIELIIVLALFMIIVGTTVSIFISMVQHQKIILEEQEIINQTSYALEYIGKALRTAVKEVRGPSQSPCLEDTQIVYQVSQRENSSDPYEKIQFIRYDGACYEFFLDHSDNDGKGVLKEIKDGGEAQNILAGKFTIEDVGFIINGDKNRAGISTPGTPQPRVTVVIRTKTLTEQKEKTFQTTISLINFDE